MNVLVLVVLGVVFLAQADALDDAKARRKARRDQIEQVVKTGQAEEGSDGYLAAKAGLDDVKTALVKAENADRKIGYEEIAKANNKSAEEIAKKAAEINKARAMKK
jgi:uncharacterized protein YdbL (DUF1318 family)